MKMGNKTPTVGVEPTSIAFQASALTFTPPRLPDVTVQRMPTSLWFYLPECSLQTTTLVTSGSLGGVLVGTLAHNARDVGSTPALCTIFPIFIKPTIIL